MPTFKHSPATGTDGPTYDRETATRTTAARWLLFTQGVGTTTEHPIAALMDEAKIAFANRLAKQSTTLQGAVDEYKRRYGRAPPRGFDHWWQFATERDFKLVDEFDPIDEDLAPFWGLSAEELRLRTYLMGHLPSIDLVRVKDGNVSAVAIKKAYVDEERGYRSLGFRELLEKFRDKLPDMDFAINAKAEGRVLVPWEVLRYPNLTLHAPFADATTMLDDFVPDWQLDGSVWEAYRRSCPPGSAGRRLYTSYRDPSVRVREESQNLDAFAFVEAVDDTYDFCENPWVHYLQGHFSPIGGRFRCFLPHYYQGANPRYSYAYDPTTRNVTEIDEMEVPWDQKSDVIFWRGATTGGGSTRFLRMAHETSVNNVKIVHASPSRPDAFMSTTVLAGDLNKDIMDVGFVSTVGSYPGGETELRSVHRFAQSVPLGKHWSYEYLLDLDEMSYSARFMAFLASDSAVLKSTVYREFFSGWIQPWLHYIPVSSSYGEIYNIHAYFSGPSTSTMAVANATVRNPAEWEAVKAERDAQLRQIARAGKRWKQTLGRTADMEVYVYRLCLEYARLWADDRDAMGFAL